MRKYKTTGNTTLFDKENTERKLTEMGDPLERLGTVVDFEMFRLEFEDVLLPKERKSNAGAKRCDVVMMFKLMVLQHYYNLSDEQAEFQIVDRTSFRRFLGLSDGDRVPDARTIWLFRERLAKSGKVGDLFQRFVDYLNGKGLIFNEGRMIDASFVSVPKQRNTPDENKRIKAGEGEGLWKLEEGDSEEDERHKANKKRHKDRDARWTQKGGQNYFGHKNHIKGDTKSKLILTQEVTPASVHDSKPRGAHLRVHGEHDAQAVHKDGRLGAGYGGDRADRPNLQHVALRANRQAQPAERLTEKKQQLADTYIRTNPQKNEQKVCHIKLKCIPLQRVEGIAQTGLRHPDNPKTSQSSIIRSPLKQIQNGQLSFSHSIGTKQVRKNRHHPFG